MSDQENSLLTILTAAHARRGKGDARGPFSTAQQRALEAALATICLRARALEDRLRAIEILVEDRGLLRGDHLSTFQEAARDERELEELVLPNRTSIRQSVSRILVGARDKPEGEN